MMIVSIVGVHQPPSLHPCCRTFLVEDHHMLLDFWTYLDEMFARSFVYIFPGNKNENLRDVDSNVSSIKRIKKILRYKGMYLYLPSTALFIVVQTFPFHVCWKTVTFYLPQWFTISQGIPLLADQADGNNVLQW